MIHYSSRCSEDNVSELTGWQKLDNPFLKVSYAHVVPRADDAGLVDAEAMNQRLLAELQKRRY